MVARTCKRAARQVPARRGGAARVVYMYNTHYTYVCVSSGKKKKKRRNNGRLSPNLNGYGAGLAHCLPLRRNQTAPTRRCLGDIGRVTPSLARLSLSGGCTGDPPKTRAHRPGEPSFTSSGGVCQACRVTRVTSCCCSHATVPEGWNLVLLAFELPPFCSCSEYRGSGWRVGVGWGVHTRGSGLCGWREPAAARFSSGCVGRGQGKLLRRGGALVGIPEPAGR